MKLSQLESLVKAMRKQAKASKIADPNVQFYDDDRSDLAEAVKSGKPFIDMDIIDNIEQDLNSFVVCVGAVGVTTGDFHIPLAIVK